LFVEHLAANNSVYQNPSVYGKNATAKTVLTFTMKVKSVKAGEYTAPPGERNTQISNTYKEILHKQLQHQLITHN